jgi:hypothetical protein
VCLVACVDHPSLDCRRKCRTAVVFAGWSMKPVMHISGRVEIEYDRALSRSFECHRELSSDFEKREFSRERVTRREFSTRVQHCVKLVEALSPWVFRCNSARILANSLQRCRGYCDDTKSSLRWHRVVYSIEARHNVLGAVHSIDRIW